MRRKISIQLKAALLMLAFSLNTVMGFACSLGIDMGYNSEHHHNSKHHHAEEATGVHIHADSSKHHHKQKAHTHSHKNEKDNCCDDSVVKLSQAEKIMPQAAKFANPVFFTAFVAVYYDIDVLFFALVNTVNKYYVSGHHPPIPDIGIAIQRFQI